MDIQPPRVKKKSDNKDPNFVSACQACLTLLGDLPVSYRNEIDRGYSTGWACVDRYMQGIRKGEVTIITADTGCGKTTFCLHLIVNCAMQGVTTWVNSWEMRPEITMRKIASIAIRKTMKLQDFTKEDSFAFDDWCATYSVFINPNTIGVDIAELEVQLKRAKKLGVEVVMIDHLDYLVNNKKEKLHEAIDETVKKLHELAFSLDMHFFLICHPRQSGTAQEQVGIHSLKGSSSIKQYADNVIILHRCSRTDPGAHSSKVKVTIAKNRMFGIEGSAYLWYQQLWDGYCELDENFKLKE